MLTVTPANNSAGSRTQPTMQLRFFLVLILGVANWSPFASASTPGVTSVSATRPATAPAFIENPRSQRARPGSTARLHAICSAEAPVSYQWLRNSALLPAQFSPTLLLTNLQWSDAAAYALRASNTYGISTSAPATLVVGNAGAVVAWGDNSYGQTNVPPNLNEVSSVSAGGYHVLALKRNGTVVAWGRNDYGQTNVPTGLDNVVAIAAGGRHSLALKADGTVVGWGHDFNGQATPPPGLSNVIAIAAGDSFNVALLSNHTVFAWGNGYAGATTVPSGLDDVVAIAAGASATVAMRSDGTVVGWGEISPPSELSNVVAIAAGHVNAAALKADGTVAVWGINYWNQNIPPSDLTNAVKIAVNYGRVLAIRSDATIVGWGLDDGGRATAPAGLSNFADVTAGAYFNVAILDDTGEPRIESGPNDRTLVGTTATILRITATAQTPVSFQWSFNGTNIVNETNAFLSLQSPSLAESGFYAVTVRDAFGSTNRAFARVKVVPPSAATGWGRNSDGQASADPFRTGICAVDCGEKHTVALRSDGTVIAWGGNFFGQTNVPVSATNVIAIAAGYLHNLAIRADGTLVGWGYNSDGQASPPPHLTNVIAAFAGNEGNFVVKRDGTVESWGRWSTPIGQVPAGLNNVVAIDAGYAHVVALKNDGTVVGWGPDWSSQAVVPLGLNNVRAIAAGMTFTIALHSNGTVAAWGDNSVGQTNIPAGLSNVVQIAASDQTAFALKSDGSVIAWGGNDSGARVVTSELRQAVAIGAGRYHGVAVIGPAVRGPLRDQIIPVGATAEFAVRGIGVGPISYQWQHAGITISGATNATLSIPNAQRADSDVYGVIVADQNGKVFAAARLSVVSFPVIETDPRDIIVPENSFATLNVEASDALGFQWFKDSSPLSGVGSSSLVFNRAQFWDAGSYFAVATNSFGSVTSGVAKLTVTSAPVMFTQQPQSRTVDENSPVGLSVGVTGTFPQFQWYKDGAPIPNATNATLLRLSMSMSDAGNYYVIASNGVSTNTSSAAVLTVRPAPPKVTLLTLTNLWRFDQSGRNLTPQFAVPEFDDSSWPEGRGVFALENNPSITPLTNTVLSITNPAGMPLTTHYFRTSFVLASNPPGTELVFSNLVDDGAVFYLNGQEIGRYLMPTGIITSTTVSSGPAPEVFIITNVVTTDLVEGTNVLAVEVHQRSAGNPDVSFGMVLAAQYPIPTPLAMQMQPQNIAAIEGTGATIPVEISGSPATFQWFKNGSPISGAVSNVLDFRSVEVGDAGHYFVMVSNSLGAVTSTIATLTVILDTNSPALSAAERISSTDISLFFSEPVLISDATNVALYAVTSANGKIVPIVDAQLLSPTNVLLKTEPLDAVENYSVMVAGVRDMALAGNAIMTSAAIALRWPAIALNSTWKYRDEGADLGTQWRAANYDDSTWAIGSALLYNDTNLVAQPPATLGTVLRRTNSVGAPITTHYFRQTFDSPVSPAGATLELRYIADDAPIFYLNGQEILRAGLPSGSVSYATPATNSPSEGSLVGTFTVASPYLIAGQNVLAAEIHQNTNDYDVAFGAELFIHADTFTNGPLVIIRQPSDRLVEERQSVSFDIGTQGDAGVQWFRNGMLVAGATDRVLYLPFVSVADDGDWFHAVISNSGTQVSSRAALLRVLLDRSAPEPVFASAMDERSPITVVFSEPLLASTATDLNRYQITNAVGENLSVLSATLINSTTVVLGTDPRTNWSEHTLIVSGVADLAALPNFSRPTAVPINGGRRLVAFDAVFSYVQTSTNIAPEWVIPEFDDTVWSRGAALLGNEPFTPVPSDPIRTTLSAPNGAGKLTLYARSKFQMMSHRIVSKLQLRLIVDDGAVVYLNGTEVLRIGMPSTVVTAGSLATRNVEASVEGPFAIPVKLLRDGDNVLAIEVHQAFSSSDDVMLGAELVASFASGLLPASPGQLTFEQKPGSLFLFWKPSACVIESAEDVGGPWNSVLQPTLPLHVLPDSKARFFRLRY
jgi:alpha-tubulin suppressor-like RCC1 family protein